MRLRKRIKHFLLRYRLGRWALIGLYPSFLDEFWRVSRAIDAYSLDAFSTEKNIRFRLCRCIHRLEKGLAMQDRHRGRGSSVMHELCALAGCWLKNGSPKDPIFLWGMLVGAAYMEALAADLNDHSQDNAQLEELRSLEANIRLHWEKYREYLPDKTFEIPLRWANRQYPKVLSELETLLQARVSVRHWIDEQVPDEVIKLAVSHALRAPSACNRQPFGIVAVKNREMIRRVGGLLVGGKGFVEEAPLLVAITGDYGAYESYNHRKLPFTDAAMSAMCFLLSLTAQGYGTLCLNWSVDVELDLVMRDLLRLDESEVILFFVAIGKPHPEALIPASVRRSAEESTRWIA